MTDSGHLFDRINESFKKQGMLSTLGASLDLVEEGRVHISLPYSGSLSQQHDFFHAGALATIADSAMGYSAMSTTPDGGEILSVEFKVSMLRPAVGSRAIARAEVIRSGKTLAFCSATVVTEVDGEEKLCLTGTGTMFKVSSTS